jgi:hypothetical protein
VAILLACAVPPTSRLLAKRDDGDIAHYFGYAQRTFDGEVPYRDFYPEYPPGFLPVVLAPGPADEGYFGRFRILMLALEAAAVVVLVLALVTVRARPGEIAAGVLLLATLPLTLPTDLVLERFDPWPSALVLLALVAMLRDRRSLGLAALGLATVAKLYPAVLLPLVLLAHHGRGRLRRDLIAFAVPALALVLPFAVIAPRGVAHVGRFLVERPLHVESLGGSLLLAAHQLGAYEPTIALSFAGSWDLTGPAARTVAVVTSLAGGAALVAVWMLFARGPRGPRDLLLASAAAIVGFVAFGKVSSPQYLVWVAAVVPLVLGRLRVLALVSFVGAALITRYVYRDGYLDLLAAGGVSWVMLARNLVLVGIFCLLVLELRVRVVTQPVIRTTGTRAVTE